MGAREPRPGGRRASRRPGGADPEADRATEAGADPALAAARLGGAARGRRPATDAGGGARPDAGLRAPVLARGPARLRRPAAPRGAAVRGTSRGPPALRRPLPLDHGRRVPGHQPGPGADGRAAGGAGGQRLRGRRRRPEHLPVPGGVAGEHGALPGLVPLRPHRHPGAQPAEHGGDRERGPEADRAQPGAPAQAPGGRGRGGGGAGGRGLGLRRRRPGGGGDRGRDRARPGGRSDQRRRAGAHPRHRPAVGRRPGRGRDPVPVPRRTGALPAPGGPRPRGLPPLAPRPRRPAGAVPPARAAAPAPGPGPCPGAAAAAGPGRAVAGPGRLGADGGLGAVPAGAVRAEGQVGGRRAALRAAGSDALPGSGGGPRGPGWRRGQARRDQRRALRRARLRIL